MELPGIGLLPDSRRVYPEGELASQVIGTVGIDNQGLTGLEAAEDDILGGDDGERIVTRDALGRGARALDDRPVRCRLGSEAHDRRVDPGDHGARDPGHRRDVAALGRHRDRHGSADVGDPRDGELAERRSRTTSTRQSPRT